MKNQSFLESLAQKCYEEYGRNADRLTVVFPNRRAGLFFRKHLGKLTDKPIWSPQITSLEDFILGKSELTPADHLQSLFILYSVYRKLLKNAEGFDKFFFWGEMILKDFNDLDTYLVNPDHIFTIIQSQKELDESFYFLPDEDKQVIKSFWSGFLPKASKTQSEFLNTWKILKPLYNQFRDELRNDGLAYKGMIYRDIAENIDNKEGVVDSGDIWFAGFNAFTASEEKIIKHYIQECGSKIFWDVDQYYLKDNYQESGFFFRQYQKDSVFQNTFPEELPNRLVNDAKQIEVTSISLGEGQVKTVAEELTNLSQSPEFDEENTVIILPDENLLIPLLNSIPSSINKVNVTMGFPLKSSQYFSFFETLLILNSGASQLKDGQQRYYFKHVLSLLNHEVCIKHFIEESKSLITYIQEHNKINLTFKEIEANFSTISKLFAAKASVEEQLYFYLEMIDEFLDGSISILDKSILFHLHSAIKNTIKSVASYDIQLDIEVFTRIFKQMGASLKVPFTGEPLEGIQVMGVLETRNLDFQNTFILSMNEGIFPSDGSSSSFIPYNIRKAFDLPVMEHNDALQSYLFYRLFHHSENINIYYNNISEFNHSGELSRLVKQLEFESGLKIERKSMINPVKAATAKPIVIQKETSILDKLNEYLVSSNEQYTRLSPSALNTYLDCRLKFFFKYVEKIKEPNEVTDDLDPALFGNLLHVAMEYLYLPYSLHENSSTVLPSDFQELINKIPEAISHSFEENKISESEAQNGRSIIAGRVIKKYIEEILKYDKLQAPFDIVGLEADHKDGYVMNLPIEVGGKTVEVALKGIIDRIDRKGDSIKILDYKSGRDERKVSKIESLFDRDSTTRNKAVMQVFYYCLLYKSKFPESTDRLIPGIFNSRDIFTKDFDVKIKYSRTFVEDFTLVEAEYTELLQEFLGEIFDPAIPFDQTDDTKKCGFCPYVGMCMRG
ncbi:MAG: hypothetical protein ACJA2S_002148 [Cyclobacteriaceae bacterium]